MSGNTAQQVLPQLNTLCIMHALLLYQGTVGRFHKYGTLHFMVHVRRVFNVTARNAESVKNKTAGNIYSIQDTIIRHYISGSNITGI